DLFQVLDPYFALPAAFWARVFPRAVFFGTDPRAEVGWRYGPHMNAFMRLVMAPLISGTPLIVNSQALAQRFRRYHPRIILGGVDTRRFDQLPSKAEARRSIGIREGRTLLVTVGKVIPVKRLEWLMAAALPVVVSDIPPHRELMQHGRTGFLARDSMEMAHQVTTLANHEDLRHSVGDAARAYVREHLDSEACTAAFLELYKGLVAGEPDRGAPADEPVERSNTHRD